MKKALSFLLVLCLMFSLTTGVFAATVTPSTADSSITAESDVAVTFSLDEDITDIQTMSYKLYYDTTLFTYKSCDIPGVTVSNVKTDGEGKQYVNFSWLDTTSQGITLKAGVLGSMTFTAAKAETETTGEFKIVFENCLKTDLSRPAQDAGSPISVTVKPAAAEPDGTAENPFLISTAADLIALSDKVYGGDTCTGLYYKVTNDIVLDSATTFRPIGTGTSKYFAGNFDGQGHTISGLNVAYYSYSGLFGSVKNATIQNLVVQGAVKGGNNTGGIVGYAVASTLRNLGNEASVSGKDTSANYIGGVAGYIGGDSYGSAGTTVEGCYNTGAVTISYNNASARAGGVVGYAFANGSVTNTVTNCYNTGSVASTANLGKIGGIVGGTSSTSSKLTITNAYNSGTLTAPKSGESEGLLPNQGSGQTLSNTYVSQPDDASKLGDAFENGTTGYPTLKWQGLGGGTPEHTHDLKLVAEVPATCTETGTKAYYECSDAECGKLFEDADGKTEITDKDTLVIPATGHTYDETLTCKVCQYVNPVLALIQEKAGEKFTAASSTTELWQAAGADGKTLEANGAGNAVFTLTAKADGDLTVNTWVLGATSKLTVAVNGTDKTVLDSVSAVGTQQQANDTIAVKKGDVITFTYSNSYAFADAENYYVRISSLSFKESEEDTTVVLTISEKTADAASAAEKATFTKTALVEKATTGVAAYQYWRGGAENLLVATQYATLADLLGDVSFGPGDKLIVKASDGFSVTYTYETLNTAKYYQAEENGALEEVPAALAIVWDSGAKTLEELKNSAYDSGSLRFGHGIASGEYGSAAGKRLVSKVSEITVVHPCETHTLADKVITAATCTETGVSAKYCTVCGYVSEETFTTEALGHDLKHTDNGDGTHTTACTRGDYSVTEAHTYENGVCSACAAEKPDYKGYTVAVSAAPAEIPVKETTVVSLTVSHSDTAVTTYSAYRFALTYDADKLTYKSVSDANATVTDSNGTLVILGYGEAKSFAQPLTVTFEGKTAGTAAVTLTEANVDAQDNAHVQDAPAAAIDPASAEIQVTAVYTVELPEGFSGADTVKHGEDYTFEAADKNYNYTFGGSTMGENAADVTDNGDGTFTVKNVTGDLTIQAEKTAKTYTVTVTGEGKADVRNAAAAATYGEDYTFTIEKEAGYIYSVVATINGVDYSVTETNGVYTIAGSKIISDIVIDVDKNEQTITTTTVRFTGSGKDDVKGGGDDRTVTIGQPFTFELEEKEGFHYVVKIGEVVYEAVEGVYTIPGAEIGHGIVVVTVEKHADYTVDVTEYVKMNGKAAFLVTVTGTPGEGSVFAYGGEAMCHSAKYDAYAYLVISDKTLAEVKTEAAAAVTEITGTAKEIGYTGDVNMTGKTDVNDAQLVWNMYNATYNDFASGATMEMFLRADVSGDKQLNVSDAAAVISTLN